MSAFTSQGFEPIKTPGSKLTDRLYRTARQYGWTEEKSIHYVFAEGWATGANRPRSAAEFDEGTTYTLYLADKAKGLTHGEALDEVFLSGYAIGPTARRPVYDHLLTQEEVRRIFLGGDA